LVSFSSIDSTPIEFAVSTAEGTGGIVLAELPLSTLSRRIYTYIIIIKFYPINIIPVRGFEIRFDLNMLAVSGCTLCCGSLLVVSEATIDSEVLAI